jgi:hypothetical protein
MIREQVPARSDLAHQIRAFCGEASYNEETGPRGVTIKKVKQLGSNRRVRPVVKRKGDAARRFASAAS